jgi:large subunit ribosomal protein L21
MKTAVIKASGRQYVVHEGDKVVMDLMQVKEGENTVFPEVLLTADGDNVVVGAPMVEGATVEGVVVKHGRHAKVFGVKMKAKKRNMTYFGHKQHFTEVEIQTITTKK